MKKNKIELKIYLLNDNKSGYKTKEIHFIKYFPEIYNDINNFILENKLYNLTFIEKLYHFLNDITIIPLCNNCKKPLKFKKSLNEGYPTYCSLKCCNSSIDHIQNIKTNNIIKYGGISPMSDEIIRNKIKNTNLNNYGCENIFSDIDYIKNKTVDKFGVDHISKLKTTKDKIKKTNLERYNVSTPLLLDKSRKELSVKLSNRFKEKYNHLEVISIDFNDIKIKCNVCNTEYIINRAVLFNRNKITENPCINCHPIKNGISIGETEVHEFLKELKISFEVHNRTVLNGQELDIYIEEKNIAIEYNGLFWHNELFIESDYHLNKTERCLDKNINLIHIFEDEWLYKNDIVKSRLKNLLGLTEKRIFARKCVIKEIDHNTSKKFLNENHIQGNVNSKIRLGLYFNNDLVSIMTFGKIRKSLGFKEKDKTFEMLRFCNILNTHVVGGASKLLNYFIKNYKPFDIISFADRRWSNGNLYKNLNFIFIKNTIPNYFYIINLKRENRFKFRKDVLIKEGFSKNKTEKSIMLERKIYRIYDSGSMLFRMNLN